MESRRQLNAERAKKHLNWITDMYEDSIAAAIARTKVYTSTASIKIGYHKTTRVSLKAMDSITALYELEVTGKVCVLNFASYKNPGGQFLNGSYAQEEALCHESVLYPVLTSFEDYYRYNRKNLNHALYTNRALYSENIIFLRNPVLSADVLTCAAPNYGTFKRYSPGIEAEEYHLDVLKSRVKFIFDVAERSEVDTFILGAWGCGVFKEKPDLMADLMFKNAVTHRIPSIVFAVPDSNSKNYAAFERALHRYGELL